MDRYYAWRAFFESKSGSSLTVTFSDLEDVLGFKLPPSAYKHNAWWSNSRTNSHWWSHHWMKAGWKRSTLDLAGQTVTFSRADLAVESDPLSSRRYWWVSHGRSYKKELAGGYIWCPQVGDEDAKRESWTNVSRVSAGDVVFSYAEQKILAVGIAKSKAFDAPPREGYAANGWSTEGWEVTIDWKFIEEPISPKKHVDELRQYLPDMHSPLKKNGEANMFYLSSISASFAMWILERSNVDEGEVESDSEITALMDRQIPVTTKVRLINARTGQGYYRNRVLQVEKACRVTGIQDTSFLIASHIKPWKDSDDNERLDGHNGLMLSPHIDRLFDRGWISFSDDGDLLIADERAKAALAAWSLSQNSNVGRFTSAQRKYLAYHRDFVYGKAGALWNSKE